MRLTLTIALLASTSIFQPLLSQAWQDRGQGMRIKVENGPEIELYAESHALIIGVSNYTNGWPNLPGVKGDVNEVSAVLREHGFTITTVTNPTRAQLDQAIRGFITKYGQGKQNRLLIYFAGHGHTIEGVGGQQGYIVPADAPDPARGESAFKDAVISMDEIEAYVRRIEAKHALWVFDSCFSGALFEATRAAPPAITMRTARPVRQFITAGTSEQRVPDKSVFRAQFVEGLRGEADRDKDGYVTGEELGLFLSTTVTNYTRSAQTPQHGKIRNPLLDKGDFVLELPKRTPLTADNTVVTPVTWSSHVVYHSVAPPAAPCKAAFAFIIKAKFSDGITTLKGKSGDLSPIYDKLGKFLEQYARVRGITTVFEVDAAQPTGMLIYASESTNITNDFMARYNQGESLTSLPCVFSVEKKLVFFDSSRLSAEIRELKTALDPLNKEFQPKKDELQKMQDEIDTLRNDIRQLGNTVSSISRKRLEDELASREKQIEEIQRAYSDFGQKRIQEVSGHIYDKVAKFLEQYAEKQGIAIALEVDATRKTGPDYLLSLGKDVTTHFIAAYNQANP